MLRFLRYVLVLVFTLVFNPSVFADSDYPYIVNSVKISGYITGLVIPTIRPDLLFAIVGPDGMPKADGKYGFYVFDIRDPVKPREMSYFKIASPRQFAIAPDGKTVFIQNTWFQGYDADANYGIVILGLSLPERPKELTHITADVFKMHLSQDGRLLFIQERNLKKESKEGIQVYGVSDPLKPIMLGNIDLQPKFPSKPLAYGMTTSIDGQRLIVRDSIDAVHVFDIRNLSAPAKVTEKHDKNLGVHLIAGSGQRVYVSGSNQFLIFNVGSSIEKIGALDEAGGGNGPFISSDEKTVLISSGKYIRTLDISNPALPKDVAKYPVPDYAGTAVKLEKHNLILAGLVGSLVIIDPAKMGSTKEGLIAAHQKALAEFNKSNANPYPYQRAMEAIRILDAAGMQEAVKKSPNGLSARRYAHILNDYAFFKMNLSQSDEAVQILRNVVRIDPNRPVAYLNLGDALRARLASAKNYDQKVKTTKEIKSAYATYKKLGGQTTASIDKFMSLNIVDKPPINVCQYVATYVDEGRPGELFRSGGELDLTNDGIEERVEIGTEGTAHNPYIFLYNKKTGDRIDIKWAGQDSNEWWGDDISLVLYKDGYYILYSAYGWYPIALTQLNPSNYERVICQFQTVVKEVVGEKCEDKALCELLLTKQRPGYLQFTEPHQLEPETIRDKSKFYETGAGKALAIDVDNDGKEEPIVELQYASGAGPGCDYNFFDKLNEDRNGIADDKTRELLVEMQGLSPKHSRHPVPHCRGNTTGWFRFNGKTYYETKFDGERPVSAAGEFHEVSYIKDSQVHKACQYDFKKKVEIKVCLDCELSEKKPAAKR